MEKRLALLIEYFPRWLDLKLANAKDNCFLSLFKQRQRINEGGVSSRNENIFYRQPGLSRIRKKGHLVMEFLRQEGRLDSME